MENFKTGWRQRQNTSARYESTLRKYPSVCVTDASYKPARCKTLTRRQRHEDTHTHTHTAGNNTEEPHLTSMDWTPSDSSSTQFFVSRDPSVMTGPSAGDRASSSEGTMRLALVSDAANTQKADLNVFLHPSAGD